LLSALNEQRNTALPLSGIQLVERGSVPAYKRRLYLQASLLSFAGNALLLAAKGVAAHMSGSSAIYADAANSASDVAYSLLMGLGLWLSVRPADPGHPHGHGRIESLVATFIGAMMGLAGVEALRTGVNAWLSGTRPTLAAWPLLILVSTGLVKGLMYSVVRRMGEKARSPAILASARDNLSDVISSAVALLGVLGSQLLFAADPLAALLVSLWIFKSAWQILGESLHHLMGGSVAPELTESVLKAAQAVAGVLGVHQIIIEHVGPQAYVDIHINMDGRVDLYQAHGVSEAVRDAVEALDGVDHAFVHVEPIES